jgi:uncharacterized protein YjbI with pentapeptide repeats
MINITCGTFSAKVDEDGGAEILDANNVHYFFKRGTDLSGITLAEGTIGGGKSHDISGTIFDGGQCAGTKFWDLILRNASFRKVNLFGASFTKTDLRGANFSESNLRGCIFSSTNVLRVDFSNSNLTNSDLSRASDVGSANFTGADLRGVRWPRYADVPAGWALTDGKLKRSFVVVRREVIKGKGNVDFAKMLYNDHEEMPVEEIVEVSGAVARAVAKR